MTFADLPALNAVLNSLTTILLLVGYGLIRQKRRDAHRVVMVAAFSVSVVFLISYLTYHFQAGATRFTGQGWIRTVYFSILISHTILAALVPPLAVITLVAGLRQRFDRHRKIARWTLPIWLYVSVTGVVIYVLLYKV